MSSPFLTAEWRWLAFLNYEIDPVVLTPFLPAGTELDPWQGKTYVSMVGFLFKNTRLRGFSIPFHSSFEEVNLRFYVRRFTGKEWRRGVVFVKELVPLPTIAWTARWFYNENYVAVPMRHRNEWYAPNRRVAYAWTVNQKSHQLEVRAAGEAQAVRENTCEEFITEHYWGYARQRDGGTVEYQVEHPRWHVWTAHDATFRCDVEAIYGKAFVPYLTPKPASAFLADGSAVSVHRGTRLK